MTDLTYLLLSVCALAVACIINVKVYGAKWYNLITFDDDEGRNEK